MRKGLLATGIIAAMSSMGVQAADDFVIDIGGISFDDLINTTITSVSKQEEKLQDAAAAVFVLTSDDIRRARVTNIPDALRLVPGVHVVQGDASSWGVSIRGFNTSVFNNKLLILVDGRSVYDPLFAGTFWEVQDTILEDIDRIEVIRGPGGTLWGSNAVNGVINITTKGAAATQGTFAQLGAGNEDPAIGSFRYGWQTESGAAARVFAKFNDHDATWNPGGSKDDWRTGRTGFRIDHSGEGGLDQTFQGEIYKVISGPVVGPADDNRIRGGNLIYRRTVKSDSKVITQIQGYYDYIDYASPGFDFVRDTLDLELQQQIPSGRHSVVWGAGIRFNGDNITESSFGAANPSESDDMTYNVFAQDTLDIPSRNLKATFGGKLSKNDFTGVEFQPSARVAWGGMERQTLWGAISRAVRIPSRLDTDFPFSAASRDDLDAEELISYEIGHRLFSKRGLTLESTAFFNDYDELIVFEQDLSKLPGLPLSSANALEGNTHGIEVNTTWKASDDWRLDASLTYLEMDLEVRPGQSGLDATGTIDQSSSIEDSDPHVRATLRSAYDVSEQLEFDGIVRYSDSIAGPGGAAKVPSYVAVDLGVTWRPRKDFEFAISGRNLFDSHQPEQVGTSRTPPTPPRSEIQRSVFGTATWRF